MYTCIIEPVEYRSYMVCEHDVSACNVDTGRLSPVLWGWA